MVAHGSRLQAPGPSRAAQGGLRVELGEDEDAPTAPSPKGTDPLLPWSSPAIQGAGQGAAQEDTKEVLWEDVGPAAKRAKLEEAEHKALPEEVLGLQPKAEGEQQGDATQGVWCDERTQRVVRGTGQG